MKNRLNKLHAVFLVCTMLLSLCACTQSRIPAADSVLTTVKSFFEKMTDPDNERHDAEAAKECLLNIMLANDAESIKAFLEADSYESASGLANYYPGTDYELTLEKAGVYQGYDLFYYTVEDAASGASEWGISILAKESDSYKLCLNPDVIQALQRDKACRTCGGAGGTRIQTGNTACGICGGTGQQYIANAYYDAIFGWQGLWQACGGCGGTGWIATYVTETCTNCNGFGIIVN